MSVADLSMARYSEILDYHNVQEPEQAEGQDIENGNP